MNTTAVNVERIVIVAQPHLSRIADLAEAHLHEVLPEHLGHRVKISFDTHLIWFECLDCKELWDHCDFCKVSRHPENKGAKRLLDFGCRKCNMKANKRATNVKEA